LSFLPPNVKPRRLDCDCHCAPVGVHFLNSSRQGQRTLSIDGPTVKKGRTKPHFWGSLDEFEGKAEVCERQGKEFTSPPELSPPTEVERREFLKLMGASLLLGTMGCARKPIEKVIPYVNQPEEITPGVANWYTSVTSDLGGGCGLLVKTREGRPIKLEGNPDHPMTRGGLNARAQASLLDLYDPDRLKGPMRVARDSGASSATSWKIIDQQIVDHLSRMRQGLGRVAVLTGANLGPTSKRLVADFLGKFSGSRHVAFDASLPEAIGLAQEAAYGERVTPRYRFDRADLIVSFGADFLGTWLSPVEFAKDFSSGRRVESGEMSRLVVFEGGLTLTGANADAHHPLRPGDEIYVALALAHELVVKRRVSAVAGDAGITKALAPYDIASVATHTGIAAADLELTATQLWAARGKGLVVGGAPKGAHAVALEVVVNLLNSLLENDGVTVDSAVAPSQQAQSTFADLASLITEMHAGKIGFLLIADCDPLLTLSPHLKFAQALKKVPMVVTAADHLHATARASDWVAPTSHALERWDDASPQRGLYSIGQPTIAPLHETRTFQDSLITWGRLDVADWYAYLRAAWGGRIRAAVNASEGPRAFWEEALHQGYVATAQYLGARDVERLSQARTVNARALTKLPSLPKAARDGLWLALYASVAQADGSTPNNGWLQELPDPVSKVSWGNYLSMAPATAKRLGLTDGDVVEVTRGETTIELPIVRQPKMHPAALMVAVGHGQEQIGRVGSHVGTDVYPLQQAGRDLPQWQGLAVTLRATGKTDPLALMQDHHTLDGRAIIKETTLAAYQDDPQSGNAKHHHHEIPSMWPKHEYPGHKWGMSIDLTTCIGCSACMIGCQAENNIPIVGKKEVMRGRDMHWIRLDRYYGGEADNPTVTFQPMLCQHCDNAPCETVCPVLATIHNDEGLNVQAYNRCVGTRYCANNCPYKVRRFNFFDYHQQYVEPMNLVLNPDVTVRTRGVMEKCTFCVQRIKESKGLAKDVGKALEDGDVQTACQQSCPTNAIAFGDVNNAQTHVAKHRKSPRGFHVLEETNVQPNVTYMTKVRA
jgi:MoCo/4Fe-4S cofactor protein with predicted Tat translocation signal